MNTIDGKNGGQHKMIPLCLATIYCVYSNIAINAATPTASNTNTNANANSTTTVNNNNNTAAEMIEDFDFSPLNIPCGAHKCFIPSKTLKEVGYLIGENIHTQLKEGYEYGQHLQETYGIPNPILGLPQNIKSDFNVAKQINQKAYKMNFSQKKKFCIGDARPTRWCKKIKPMTVQKVRRVPDDDDNTFFVKCKDDRDIKLTRSKWESQQKSLSNTTTSSEGGGGGTGTGWLSLRHSSIKNKDLFLHQFQKSIDQLALIMENEPLFVHDMQFLVTTEGQIHHMDYDRVVEGQIKREKDPNGYSKMVKQTRKPCLEFLYQMKHDAVVTNTAER